MNFLKFPAESAFLIQHIENFVKQHRLVGRQKKIVLAISGGPDSMALFCLASLLRQRDPEIEFRVLTIHHHSRAEQDVEVQTVARIAADFSMPTQILHIDPKNWEKLGNFEARASKLRKELILANLQPGEVVFTGHHLEDSLEWFLMQLGRSSDPQVLGLPLVNGLWRRPFLCLTKQQIFWLLKWSGLPFAIDPTNEDFKHERNWMRSQVVRPWKRRSAGLLRHYATRSNLLAMKLGVHRLSQDGDKSEIINYRRGVSLVAQSWAQQFDPLRVEQMREIVKSLSAIERGELTRELEKLCHAMRTGRKGPHLLSGGVSAYLWGREVFFLARRDQVYYQKLDQQWESIASQIPDQWLESQPLKRTQKNGMKVPHPLFPLTTKRWLELGISFQTPARAN